MSISGTYSGLGDSGTFSLTYDSSYERPSSLSLVQGDWFISDPQIFEKLSINIDSNGKIIGFSSKGDILSGNVDPKLSGFCWPVISQFIQHKIRHILEISKVICKQ